MQRLHPAADHRKNLIEHHTRDIDVRWFNGQADLSETPIAYKNAEEIRRQIDHFQLANVIGEIQPLGCIMAGKSKTPPWKRDEEELTPKQRRQIQHRAERRSVKQQIRHPDTT